MNNKEYKKIYTEVQDLINDFGFADPYNIITELKAIFDVDDCDINKTGLVRGKTTYEVHYDVYLRDTSFLDELNELTASNMHYEVVKEDYIPVEV